MQAPASGLWGCGGQWPLELCWEQGSRTFPGPQPLPHSVGFCGFLCFPLLLSPHRSPSWPLCLLWLCLGLSLYHVGASSMVKAKR